MLCLNYDICLFCYDENDDDYLTDDQINELSVLIYQKVAEDKPEILTDSIIEGITNDYETIYESITYDPYGKEIALAHLNTIHKFLMDNNKKMNAKKIEKIMSVIKNKPIAQLHTIRSIMRNYMFEVDKDLFGLQTNSHSATGSCVDNYMISCNKEFSKYDYAASIGRSMSGPPANKCEIEILFKCDKDSDITTVDFKLHRKKKVEPCCLTYGKFVGDFGSIKINLSDPEQAQKDICNKLNECMKALMRFLKKHPKVNSDISPNEKVIKYGMIS